MWALYHIYFPLLLFFFGIPHGIYDIQIRGFRLIVIKDTHENEYDREKRIELKSQSDMNGMYVVCIIL